MRLERCRERVRLVVSISSLQTAECLCQYVHHASIPVGSLSAFTWHRAEKGEVLHSHKSSGHGVGTLTGTSDRSLLGGHSVSGGHT